MANTKIIPAVRTENITYAVRDIIVLANEVAKTGKEILHAHVQTHAHHAGKGQGRAGMGRERQGIPMHGRRLRLRHVRARRRDHRPDQLQLVRARPPR